jgi:hypothetical protein
MVNMSRIMPISARTSISEMVSTNPSAEGPIMIPVSKKPIIGGNLSLAVITIRITAKKRIIIMSFSKIMVYLLRLFALFIFPGFSIKITLSHNPGKIATF